jgi:HK97 family phage prohead protease
MPWHIENDNPDCSGWAVVKDSDGSIAGCHPTKAKAQKQLAALNINVKGVAMPDRSEEPREGLFRMVPNSIARAETADDGNTLTGYAAVFDTWADIDGSSGSFRERVKPGAFKRTLNNNGDKIKVMFNHGMDPQIGMKPLGKPTVLEERAGGLYTETPLDKTSYNEDLKASLASGAIDGMSFQFDVVAQEWNDDGTERTITEVKLYEFGPVTWPAYETTSAGIRSKGVYGQETAAPSKSARRKAPDLDARDTSAQEARVQTWPEHLQEYWKEVSNK